MKKLNKKQKEFIKGFEAGFIYVLNIVIMVIFAGIMGYCIFWGVLILNSPYLGIHYALFAEGAIVWILARHIMK